MRLAVPPNTICHSHDALKCAVELLALQRREQYSRRLVLVEGFRLMRALGEVVKNEQLGLVVVASTSPTIGLSGISVESRPMQKTTTSAVTTSAGGPSVSPPWRHSANNSCSVHRLCHHHRPHLDSIRIRATAMVFIMIFLIVLSEAQLVSVYATRSVGLAGAPAPCSPSPSSPACLRDGRHRYGISIVLQSIIGIPFALSVLILGVVTVGRHARRNSCGRDLRRDSDGDLCRDRLCVVYSVSAVGGVSRSSPTSHPSAASSVQNPLWACGRRLQQHRSHRRYAVRILADAARRPVSLRVLLRDRPDTGAREPPQRTSTTPTAR